jgi:hypothetical protein
MPSGLEGNLTLLPSSLGRAALRYPHLANALTGAIPGAAVGGLIGGIRGGGRDEEGRERSRLMAALRGAGWGAGIGGAGLAIGARNVSHPALPGRTDPMILKLHDALQNYNVDLFSKTGKMAADITYPLQTKLRGTAQPDTEFTARAMAKTPIDTPEDAARAGRAMEFLQQVDPKSELLREAQQDVQGMQFGPSGVTIPGANVFRPYGSAQKAWRHIPQQGPFGKAIDEQYSPQPPAGWPPAATGKNPFEVPPQTGDIKGTAHPAATSPYGEMESGQRLRGLLGNPMGSSLRRYLPPAIPGASMRNVHKRLLGGSTPVGPKSPLPPPTGDIKGTAHPARMTTAYGEKRSNLLDRIDKLASDIVEFKSEGGKLYKKKKKEKGEIKSGADGYGPNTPERYQQAGPLPTSADFPEYGQNDPEMLRILQAIEEGAISVPELSRTDPDASRRMLDDIATMHMQQPGPGPQENVYRIMTQGPDYKPTNLYGTGMNTQSGLQAPETPAKPSVQIAPPPAGQQKAGFAKTADEGVYGTGPPMEWEHSIDPYLALGLGMPALGGLTGGRRGLALGGGAGLGAYLGSKLGGGLSQFAMEGRGPHVESGSEFGNPLRGPASFGVENIMRLLGALGGTAGGYGLTKLLAGTMKDRDEPKTASEAVGEEGLPEDFKGWPMRTKKHNGQPPQAVVTVESEEGERTKMAAIDPRILNALIGGGIGATAGGLSSMLGPVDEDDSRLRRGLGGGILGGLVGAGLGGGGTHLFQMYREQEAMNRGRRHGVPNIILNKLKQYWDKMPFERRHRVLNATSGMLPEPAPALEGPPAGLPQPGPIQTKESEANRMNLLDQIDNLMAKQAACGPSHGKKKKKKRMKYAKCPECDSCAKGKGDHCKSCEYMKKTGRDMFEEDLGRLAPGRGRGSVLGPRGFNRAQPGGRPAPTPPARPAVPPTMPRGGGRGIQQAVPQQQTAPPAAMPQKSIWKPWTWFSQNQAGGAPGAPGAGGKTMQAGSEDRNLLDLMDYLIRAQNDNGQV